MSGADEVVGLAPSKARIRAIGGHHRGYEGRTDVWLTPPEILAKLGPFDLDPCAAPEPRPWPTAARHYVEADGGLSQPWSGRVWLNPPYGPRVYHWLDRLADHGEGTALVFARTETVGFQRAAARADAILFLAGRLHFHYPNGERAAANAGAPSCFLAFSERDVALIASSGLPGFLVRPRATTARALPQSLFGAVS